MTQRLLTLFITGVWLLVANHTAQAQIDIEAAVLKHLTTSREFTLTVADQMPDADGDRLKPDATVTRNA